jgi:hypothetical protein
VTSIRAEQRAPTTARPEWRAVVARYQGADVPKSIWQLVSTGVPLAVMFVLTGVQLAAVGAIADLIVSRR